MILGLVPDTPVDGVRSVGNAAGAGAVRALLSRELRAEMEEAVRGVTKIETATEPRFQELFVAAMGFPHATAPKHGDAVAAADGVPIVSGAPRPRGAPRGPAPRTSSSANRS